MAKAVKSTRKKKKDEEVLEVLAVDVEEAEEVDADEVEETEEVDTDEVDADEEEAVVEVAKSNDTEKSVTVLVLKDVPRFFVGTKYHEALSEGEKVKLPNHVAKHLEERGRAKIV